MAAPADDVAVPPRTVKKTGRREGWGKRNSEGRDGERYSEGSDGERETNISKESEGDIERERDGYIYIERERERDRDTIKKAREIMRVIKGQRGD